MKIPSYLLLLIFSITVPVLPQSDSSQQASATRNSILLAKTDSYFENQVAKLVERSLVEKGFTVRIVPLDELGNELPKNFKAIILFNVVNTDKLLPYVRAYITRETSTNPDARFLICDVYGKDWSKKETPVDAATSATDSAHPEKIAGNVVKNVLKAMGNMNDGAAIK